MVCDDDDIDSEEEYVIDTLLQMKKERFRSGYGIVVTHVLNIWFYNHIDKPYPTSDEKEILMECTGITLCQLNNWMSNARRRKLK